MELSVKGFWTFVLSKELRLASGSGKLETELQCKSFFSFQRSTTFNFGFTDQYWHTIFRASQNTLRCPLPKSPLQRIPQIKSRPNFSQWISYSWVISFLLPPIFSIHSFYKLATKTWSLFIDFFAYSTIITKKIRM